MGEWTLPGAGDDAGGDPEHDDREDDRDQNSRDQDQTTEGGLVAFHFVRGSMVRGLNGCEQENAE